MKKIFAYMKSYWHLILLATLLLFVQTNMDLALPDYMSRIVNIGIQQTGIQSALPEVISRESFDKIILLAAPENKQMLIAAYKEISPGKKQYDSLFSRFPGIEEKESLYLNAGDKKIIPELEAAMQNALASSFIASLPPSMAARQKEMETGKAGFILKRTAIQAVQHEYESLGADIGSIQRNYIFKTGFLMIIFTLISVFSTIMVSLIAARSSAGTAQRIRSDLFSRVESFSAAEFDTFSTASLITRCTNDITQIQILVFMMIRMVMYAPIMGIGGVIRALGKAPSMAWLIGLAVFALFVLVSITAMIALPKFKLTQKLVDKLNRIAREQLSGIMVVRAFNREQFEEQRFDKANSELTGVNLFIIRLMATMMPFIMLIMNILSVAIIWVGAKEIAASKLLIGDMIAFLQYAMYIVMAFMMLTMLFIFLPRAMISAGRISEVLDTEPSISDPGIPLPLPENGKGQVEFKNVSFRYPGADQAAVCNISFTADPGKTTAIVGSTGSGKSTLVNLLPRFYDVSEGEILLDGTDIRRLKQDDLRSRIAYVPQKAVLFSGTIKSNLAYADENAGRSELEDAAETAQAAEFINEKPEGMASQTAQAGSNFSGGQKQRLSIARALVKKCPVLVFDDSFSALDFRTDAALRHALKNKTAEKTIIIIAQRVSTIMNADQIIVLDDGKIVGKGTHRELLKTCTAYREIAVSQLDMEEPA